MRHVRCLFIIALAFATNGYSVAIRHDRSDADYINLGSQFPSVGTLPIGSGTLIAPTWVLTAAHLTGAIQPGISTFVVGGNAYVIAEVRVHPNFININSGNDIALVRLASPVLNITPAAYNTVGMELGRTAIVVGFGQTGTGLTGQQAGTEGTKRGAENVVDLYGDGAALLPSSSFLVDFDTPALLALDNFSGSPTPLNLEGLGVAFDSGGPDFIDFGEGPVVAGVHSYLFARDGATDGDYGDVLGSTRVALYSDFIAAAVPEPSHLALISGSILVVARLFRKRR